MSLVEVKGLCIDLPGKPLVRDVDFTIAPGECLALVGESGSGKSLSALALLDLLPAGLQRRAASLRLDGTDIQAASPAMLRSLRGNVAGMIFQEPMSSLNPLMRIGRQVAEAVTLHRRLPKSKLLAATMALLAEVGLPDAAATLDKFPHQLSGGQRQRVMIAMALANNPKLLIADEPTTALDHVLERQILDLIAAASRARGLAVLLITHDLEIVQRYADRVAVMQDGVIVETGPAAQIFAAPAHDMTRKLLAARHLPPPLSPPAQPVPVLVVEHVSVAFAVTGGILRRQKGAFSALHDVSFTLHRGETLGLVGPSGSGKSTLTLALLRLINFTGRVSLDGVDLAALNARMLRATRGRIQIIFQDPFGSLSPRLTVREIIAEGLEIHEPAWSAVQRAERVRQALAEVRLPPDAIDRYPNEFSGGQRQRIAIARAIVLNPLVLILDEPTSALDVTVQADIIALLKALQARLGLAYLFISHDLSVIRAISHRVLALDAGRLIEYTEV
ncbi:MAG: microcin ABC transporter ATP-binding protein [Rhodospirillales bacterium 20-60-12]|nr:MAG: microcin ABC transporter ATP-binding protein [Rhodospirillales bacterium 20-60-12]HQT68483.1 dipeptide ABC transporter ATP-binding protein [Acetobacteraceae bacterium]